MKTRTLTQSALVLAFALSMPLAFAADEGAAVPPPTPPASVPAVGNVPESTPAPGTEKKADKSLSKKSKKNLKKVESGKSNSARTQNQ